MFVQVIEPVGSGFVESLARPGGKFEYSLAGKWVELLKQIAPHVTRAAVIRDPTRGPGIGQFAMVQACLRNGTHDRGVRALPQRRADRDGGRNCV